MGDNDKGYHHPNAIDKGIKHVDASAGTQQPPGLSMKALAAPTIPHGVLPEPPHISSAVSADLKKLSPSLAADVRQSASRK
jgi:hypothetical protein